MSDCIVLWHILPDCGLKTYLEEYMKNHTTSYQICLNLTRTPQAWLGGSPYPHGRTLVGWLGNPHQGRTPAGWLGLPHHNGRTPQAWLGLSLHSWKDTPRLTWAPTHPHTKCTTEPCHESLLIFILPLSRSRTRKVSCTKQSSINDVLPSTPTWTTHIHWQLCHF